MALDGDVRNMDVQVSWNRDAGVLVASLTGRVDGSNSAALHEALKEGMPEGERTLALDCAQLTYMSSAGLRVVLDMSRRFQGPNRAMGLCGLPEGIESVVRLSGFDKIIPVHESVADAVAAIASKVDVGPAADAAEEAGEDEQESSGGFRFRLGDRSL
ncbi:MAG: STAS domain-containing protein [Gemmatimonadetes bacterium]|nr:STAS domain-containing protein [Gemmatimonadota bacterium]MYD13251.1 STAS domain-containing protein [Gemmatimonadota bacterium]MYI66290.1 STAS domain-containing protein [Gemmatimonadota bacterium]